MPTRLTKAQRKRQAYNRRYQREHREELLKKRRKYAAKHRKQLNKAWSDWAHRNPEKIAKYRKRKNAWRRRMRREARLAAKRAKK